MMDPGVDSIWPVSAAGWLALVLSILSAAGMLVGWGKMLAKFEEHDKKLDSVDEIDTRLTGLDTAFWGPMKNNGLYSMVRSIDLRVDEIESRNRVIDALNKERERGAAEAGREDRSVHRRREDKLAFGESSDQ